MSAGVLAGIKYAGRLAPPSGGFKCFDTAGKGEALLRRSSPNVDFISTAGRTLMLLFSDNA